MQTFGLTRVLLLKIILVILSVLMVLSRALATELKEPDKVVSRDGPKRGVSYVNFVEEKFSYLNITALGGDFVDNMPECSFACLDTPSCFSFNLGATPDISDRFPCELLASDKYNNSDKFVRSYTFHHFSIATPCSTWPCKNKGKCLPLYEENHYKCLCTKGFKGKNCENDIDECSSANECHLDATCTNAKGSYNCTCQHGFVGDGKNCMDIDECSIENECHQNATCNNTKGSYNCTCKDGFEGNGKNCADIDECSIANDCHLDATCNNTKGSYNCTCKDGFKGDGKNCMDIDECSIENDCHQNATCSNTKGSYSCTCKGGFKGDGKINCMEHRWQDSVIIGDNQTYFVMLSRWLRPVAQSNGQWILCWRASLHGWTAATFHSLCDNKGPTVTIVKDTNNNIFGGYTSIPWRSENRHKNDSMAFLFSLKNPTNNPLKLHQIDNSSLDSVGDYASYGPIFGKGWDLGIEDRANMSIRSHEHLGHTYTVPSGITNKPFFTGNNHYRANEIETFYEIAQ